MMAERFKKLMKVVVLSAGCSLPQVLHAYQSQDQAALCESAIVAASQKTGVPQNILHAISLTETGRRQGDDLRPWPWAVNREGRGYWFATREEALAFAKRSVGEGRYSFDTGCFQINYHWHGENFASVEEMFDPDAGAMYAGRFLRDLYSETGDWSAAAGAYHSRTPHFARIYRARFDRILAQVGRTELIAVAEKPKPPKKLRTKSRTRLARKPLIITIERKNPPVEPVPVVTQPAEIVAERVVFRGGERGMLSLNSSGRLVSPAH